MHSSEEMLEIAARDGSIDIEEWPRVLESLLKRLHHIVHTEFPLPSIPLPAPLPPTIDPEVVASTPPLLPSSDSGAKDDELPDAEDDENNPPPNSQSSTKENDEPPRLTPSRPPVPPFDTTPLQQQSDPSQPPPAPLPPDLLSLYTSSTRILQNHFANTPPYTLQRLAELALHPKRHYRYLPAYLRALDRILSVSSPVTEFPLPSLYPVSLSSNFITNGNTLANGTADHDALGSDESLGGALLTPIPWLRNNSLTNNSSSLSSSHSSSGSEGEFRSERTETIEGPNGAGSIETVSVTLNGVPSATSSLAHTTPVPGQTQQLDSPTLSDQSDASSSTSSGPTTEAEMREQGAVTQGELLRQEQEAGVIPVSQGVHSRSLLSAGAAAVVGREGGVGGSVGPANGVLDDERAGAEEAPHARGPDEIGMEDVGAQYPALGEGGLDMEAAVGRGRSKSPQPPMKGEEEGEEEAEKKDVEMGEEKGELVVVADAEGVVKGEVMED